MLIYNNGPAILTASAVQGNLTIDSSAAVVTLTAATAQIQGNLVVHADTCSSVTFGGVYAVVGSANWRCEDDTRLLTLPLSTVGGNLEAFARSIAAPSLTRVVGNITGSYGQAWPGWSAPLLSTVGGLLFSGIGGGSGATLLFPSLLQAGLVDLNVLSGVAAVQVDRLMVSEQLKVTMTSSSAQLTVNGTLNTTGTVDVVVASSNRLSWNLTQGGDTTICDGVREDPALDTLKSVHNLTLGCRSQAIAPQTMRSLLVVLGTLRADLPSSSNKFQLPAFPSLRSINNGLCLTSVRVNTVDLSPLLKASVSGTCYIQDTIQLSSACPCREGCQSHNASNCY